MSDFDKEAEREKLREKYGDDEANRETTEQMSELLLKGATMTNAHCNNCGDPIFRYDGQEFCPTCQQPVDRGEADEAADADEDNIEVTTPSDEATVQFGGEPDSEASGQSNADEQPSASAQSPSNGRPAEESQPTHRTVEQSHSAPSVDPASTATESAATRQPSDPEPTATESVSSGTDATATTGTASDHLASAQVLLAQTVEEYAKRARETDSPRQAQEYLEAAREAAETLDETGF